MAFKSGFERRLAMELERAKVGFKYESSKIPYVIKHTYSPDFVLDNGVIIEAKGYLRATDIAKMRAVKAQHPELDIRFVFQDASNKVRKKTTYAEWAERHGFPWAEGSIPKEWTTS